MNQKRPLVPQFLQNLDDKLLRNKPSIWQYRTHLVAYFSLLLAAALSLFCFLVFFDSRLESEVGSWVTFVVVLIVIGLVFYLIYLLRFNVFKRFGNWNKVDSLKSYLYYFLSVGCMVALAFLPSAIETFRANRQFSDEEIVKDINEANLNIVRLEYNNLPKRWTFRDYKLVVSNKLAPVEYIEQTYDDKYIDTMLVADGEYVDTALAETVVKQEGFNYADSSQINGHYRNGDSIVKLKDSFYRVFSCPVYQYINPSQADNYTKESVLTAEQIYKIAVPAFSNANKAEAKKNFDLFEKKWKPYKDDDYYSDYTYPNTNTRYNEKISRKYQTSRIERPLSNAIEKKQEWRNNWLTYFRGFFYTVLVVSLLIFIFRHTTKKTFFLSLLVAALLSIITGVLIALAGTRTNFYNSELTVLSFYILYLIIFGVIAISINASQKQSTIKGIALNLFTFMLPWIPLIIVALNQAIYKESIRAQNLAYNEQKDFENAYGIAEFVCPVLLLLAIQFLISKLYRKWYALPED
jgi:hypothetical protein